MACGPPLVIVSRLAQVERLWLISADSCARALDGGEGRPATDVRPPHAWLQHYQAQRDVRSSGRSFDWQHVHQECCLDPAVRGGPSGRSTRCLHPGRRSDNQVEAAPGWPKTHFRRQSRLGSTQAVGQRSHTRRPQAARQGQRRRTADGGCAWLLLIHGLPPSGLAIRAALRRCTRDDEK